MDWTRSGGWGRRCCVNSNVGYGSPGFQTGVVCIQSNDRRAMPASPVKVTFGAAMRPSGAVSGWIERSVRHTSTQYLELPDLGPPAVSGANESRA
ncbi:MAG: hypothetical protein MNPFHGCM_02563 [Gemmatimonadaceae bacterium]|nr:hypothetical protein [Gemmatimonadaceae bacterium]